MKHFSFYHKHTGLFAEITYSATAPEVALNTQPDHIAIAGRYHPLAHKFDLASGGVVRADRPEGHEWHEGLGRWVPAEWIPRATGDDDRSS